MVEGAFAVGCEGFEDEEVEDYACEFQVRNGQGAVGVGRGGEQVLDPRWPLEEPHRWGHQVVAAEPHAAYSPTRGVDEASVSGVVFDEFANMGGSAF